MFFQSCGKLEQGQKQKGKVKLKTSSHVRFLTGDLPRIPNREVREADPIQPLYAVHFELRSVTRAWFEIDHVTISNSLMEIITNIAHCYDVHVTACRTDHISVRLFCNSRSRAHGGASCMTCCKMCTLRPEVKSTTVGH